MAGDDDRGRRPALSIVPPPDPRGYAPSGGDQSHLKIYDPSGVSMLDIIRGAAQAARRSAVQPDGTVNVDLAAKAAFIAREALPYESPKLAAVVVKNVSEDEDKRKSLVKADSDDVRRRLTALAGVRHATQ
jgi:hypothetical protein